MRYPCKAFCLAILCTVASTIRSSENEEAHLSATINPGALEIAPSSLATEFQPIQTDITLTGTTQTDAITFNISAIEINDLNGDGLGWKLTASPQILYHDGNGSTLPVGTIIGFQNSSDIPNTTIANPNELQYTSGSGVSNYTVDYQLSYTVPTTASAGDYNGIIIFNIVAE
ncbi:MAG: type 1 fimbria pilin [Candidatus Pelagisphaera sp.]|jgi:type 1 fimbria pilin